MSFDAHKDSMMVSNINNWGKAGIAKNELKVDKLPSRVKNL